MTDAGFWVLQTLNALQLSMLLFLLSIGLTVIFGLMHFVNLAHGALYALGAYLAATLAGLGGYWLGFLLAPIGVAGVGVLLYAGLIRHLRQAGPMAQVLVTFGLIFALLDLTRIIWGDLPLSLNTPAALTGRVALLGVEYPIYRLFVIALGVAVLAGLALVLNRTQVGAMIRAGVDNDAMAACLGIRVERLFFLVFCVGCALAGLAGAVAAPLLSVRPEMGLEILIPTLIVIVIGGLGSLKGAVAGSLVFGFVQTFGAVLAPQLASVLIYGLLAAVLVLRPAGLFPVRGLETARMFRHTPLRYATLLLLAAGGILYAFTAGYFGLEILAEIAILAMLAVSLDLVAGFGGMVSLCHGALMGAGAYAYALLSTEAGLSPPLAMAAAMALAGAVAWLIGAICARTHGIFFIMATLAFGQMGYAYVFESPLFGGDDGLAGIPRLDLSALGIDLGDSRTFALFCLAALALAYGFAALLLRSGMGQSLVGILHNEQRMRALGLTVWRTKADMFGLSGLIAGAAGALAAQHSMFISPGLLSWTVSGEALVVVILGGLGTLVGPLVGAAAFVSLKHEISAYTNHWHLIVGAILIAVVMTRANGLFGWLEARAARLRRPGSAGDA